MNNFMITIRCCNLHTWDNMVNPHHTIVSHNKCIPCKAVIELIYWLIQKVAILVLCPCIVSQLLNEVERVLCNEELPSLHPLDLKLEFVTLDRSILVTGSHIESSVNDVLD